MRYRINTAMIEMGQEYHDRKAALERLYSKKWGYKLIEEVHRIEA